MRPNRASAEHSLREFRAGEARLVQFEMGKSSSAGVELIEQAGNLPGNATMVNGDDERKVPNKPEYRAWSLSRHRKAEFGQTKPWNERSDGDAKRFVWDTPRKDLRADIGEAPVPIKSS